MFKSGKQTLTLYLRVGLKSSSLIKVIVRADTGWPVVNFQSSFTVTMTDENPTFRAVTNVNIMMGVRSLKSVRFIL